DYTPTSGTPGFAGQGGDGFTSGGKTFGAGGTGVNSNDGGYGGGGGGGTFKDQSGSNLGGGGGGGTFIWKETNPPSDTTQAIVIAAGGGGASSTAAGGGGGGGAAGGSGGGELNLSGTGGKSYSFKNRATLTVGNDGEGIVTISWTTSTPTVDPVPNQTACNEGLVGPINFTGTATTFSWVNNNPNIGLPASGSGNISQFSATNTTSSPIIATITVTPSTGVHIGTPTTFTISVKPTPMVNPIPNQTFTAGDIAGPIIFTGTTDCFNWTNSNTAIGLAASGYGNIPSFTTNNDTSTIIEATITVTPLCTCTSSGDIAATTELPAAPSNAITFTITVLPSIKEIAPSPTDIIHTRVLYDWVVYSTKHEVQVRMNSKNNK
ncbi:MAG: hypothetical protein RLZ12_820, partial [Bacillota bacterium]